MSRLPAALSYSDRDSPTVTDEMVGPETPVYHGHLAQLPIRENRRCSGP